MSVTTMPVRLKTVGDRSENESESGSWIWRKISENIDDIKSVEMWQACFAELVGVFFLGFFTIAVGVSKDGETPAPLIQGALGAAFFITVIITSLSGVSGGHVNPAISIGFLVTNRITIVRFILYSLFQVTGSVVGVATLRAVLPAEYRGNLGLILPGDGVPSELAVAMEVMITGLLLFNTISFTDSHREDVHGSIPYMVGLTVGVNVLAGAKISGGCMNPARALGSAIVVGDMNSQWIYWVGPLLGAVLGALLYDWFFSTRPLRFITKAIVRTRPVEKRRRRQNNNGMNQDDEMMESTEHTKLNA